MSTNILNYEPDNLKGDSASYLAKKLMIADENASQNNQNEHEHQVLVNNIHVGIVKQDKDGKIIVVNNAALDMLGLTKDQMMGITSVDPSWNVIHEDGSDFPGDTHPTYVVMTTYRPVHDVVMGVYRPKTKDRVWILVNAEPQFDEVGNFSYAFCTFTDISQYKTLQTDLQVKNQILNSISEYSLDIMSVIDENYYHVYVNKSGTTLTGFSIDELLKMTALDIAPSHLKNNMKGILDKAKQQGAVKNIIGKIICKDATKKYISWSLQWDEATKLMYVNGQDVTEEIEGAKRIEQQRVLAERQIKQSLFDAEEQKRNDIGFELHENVGQLLATAKLYLELFEKGASKSILHESKSLLSMCIEELRNITYLNALPKFNEIGLKGALEMLLQIQLKKKEIVYGLNFMIDDAMISSDNSINIYRIIQLWLGHVTTKSSVESIVIDICADEANLFLKIINESMQNIDLTYHVSAALVPIKERLSIINGSVIVQPSEDNNSYILTAELKR
jgi:PAS domain S-box-containing protein